ncbi:hypothetical protein BC937DRAFT_91181 [Endogone sp. FLAS-F59071]|nr:hypothetical protein BC937DRAFT_91181 [Endogone sp. FLAS-F59071]|eukprot:RUS16452.1 hypothetical protein BC937DRAFT_91181 [Endogone sp. FLAS-F59071]
MASSLEILNLAASEGDKILLVATPNVDQNQLLTLKNTFVNQVSTSGVVAFEQLERVAVSPLPKGNYTAIYSNLIQPSVETHSTNTLQKFLETLAPGGSLTLRELVLTSFLPPAACPVNRTSQSLASTLKLAGFIDVTVRFVDTIPDTDLVDYFHAWGATRVEQGIEVLGGKLAVATVVARKPAYEVGQKMALNFTKISTQPNKTSTQPPRRPKVVWTILDDDNDDVELEDEDDLLDETDKVKPSKESLARKLS